MKPHVVFVKQIGTGSQRPFFFDTIWTAREFARETGGALYSALAAGEQPMTARAVMDALRLPCLCEDCGKRVEAVNEADQCDDCAEAYADARIARWWPVYLGEHRAGLHGEFTDEGLQMRAREQGEKA